MLLLCEYCLVHRCHHWGTLAINPALVGWGPLPGDHVTRDQYLAISRFIRRNILFIILFTIEYLQSLAPHIWPADTDQGADSIRGLIIWLRCWWEWQIDRFRNTKTRIIINWVPKNIWFHGHLGSRLVVLFFLCIFVLRSCSHETQKVLNIALMMHIKTNVRI